MRLRLAPLFAGALALAACSQAVGQNPTAAKVDPAFGAKVRAYLLEHPEVLNEVLERLREKERTEAQAAAKGALSKYRTALERDGRDFVANPNGKVTVTEFFDYRCSYCKQSAPEVVAFIKANPDVRFVFKDLVIFGEASDYAAAGVDAARASGKVLDIHQALMSERALDRAGVDRVLRANGVDPTGVKVIASSAETAKHRADTHALARALGVEGTPAFVVGDTIVPGADLDAVKAAVAEARKGAPAAA